MFRSNWVLIAALADLALCAYAISDFPYETLPTVDSLSPVQIIAGDQSQIYEGAYFSEASNSQTLTNSGLWGFDEMPTTQLADGRILGLTGDTVAAYFNSGASKWMGNTKQTCASGNGAGTGSCLGVDTVIFWTPSSTDWQCSHLPDVDNAMIGGNLTPSIGYTNCPVFTVVTDPSHNGTSVPKMWYTSEHVSGITSGDMLGGHTPDALWASGTNLYTIIRTDHQNRAKLNYGLKSQLFKITNSALITATNVPTITRLYDVSTTPTIPTGNATVTIGSANVTWSSGNTFVSTWANNPSVWNSFEIDGNDYQISSVTDSTHIVLTTVVAAGKTCLSGACSSILWNVTPSFTGNVGGKFMFGGSDSYTHAQTISYGWNAQLPSALQSASNVVIVTMTGYYYRHSNVYSFAIDASLVDGSSNSGAGIADAWYVSGFDNSGNPTWTQGAEASAVPLLTSWANASAAPCIGEMSTRYYPILRRLLMSYGSAECGGMRVRSASAPWGPWSADQRVMPNTQDSGWEGRLLWGPTESRNPNFNTTASVALYDASTTCCTQLTTGSPYALPGNFYGLYLWPASTSHDNGDGTATILANVSGFSPYQSWMANMVVSIPKNTRAAGFHGASGVHFK